MICVAIFLLIASCAKLTGNKKKIKEKDPDSRQLHVQMVSSNIFVFLSLLVFVRCQPAFTCTNVSKNADSGYHYLGLIAANSGNVIGLEANHIGAFKFQYPTALDSGGVFVIAPGEVDVGSDMTLLAIDTYQNIYVNETQHHSLIQTELHSFLRLEV